MTVSLAAAMRPTHLDGLVGHRRWIAPGAPLRRAAEAGRLFSIVLWGPPGCGKTTLARLLAQAAGRPFVARSAVLDGVSELRTLLREAPSDGVVLFLDEIHRWSRMQQDALLPHLELGTVALIGATTENPTASLTPALRSRVQLVHLEPLSVAELRDVVARALAGPLASRANDVETALLDAMCRTASGDARRVLDDLERLVIAFPEGPIDAERAGRVLDRAALRHDRDDAADVMSALIKSMRGSDPDAALYWLARLIEGGEDALAIARRLVVFASEDVGNADPRGLWMATSAVQSIQAVGMPEGQYALAQVVIWLAAAPKSDAVAKAVALALEAVHRDGSRPVPRALRLPTSATRGEGAGDGYRNPHDFRHHVVAASYWPDDLDPRTFYAPDRTAEERTLLERLAWFRRKARNSESSEA